MSETVLLAIIGGAVTLLTALIGKLSFDVGKTKKDASSAAKNASAAAADAKEARKQVKNTHTTNLREEQDERHEEITAALSNLREVVDGLKSSTTETARDVRGLREDHYSTRKDMGLIHAQTRSIHREISELKAVDEQTRQEHVEAVAERGRQMNQLRSDIPGIVQREIRKTQDGGTS